LIRVSEKQYPALFACFEIISHDSGGGAGHKWYGVPEEYLSLLPSFDASLNDLDEEDRETLCIGEHDDQEALADRRGVQGVHNFLNTFFESDWPRR